MGFSIFNVMMYWSRRVKLFLFWVTVTFVLSPAIAQPIPA